MYPQPSPGYEPLKDHLAFYPGRIDAAWLDDERVRTQDGDFYGGWITAELVGPFKGAPGTTLVSQARSVAAQDTRSWASASVWRF